MRKASYAMATPCSLDASGRMRLAVHPGNHNRARRELADMGCIYLSEGVRHCLALAMPDFRAGVNGR